MAGRGLRGVRRLRGRRTRGAGHLPVGAPPGQLPAARSRRGADHAGVGHRGVLVLGFESADHPVDRVDGPRPRAVPRPRRRAARAGRATPTRPTSPAAAARATVALGVPADALPARRARRARHDRRDLRDRLHVGPLPRAPRRGRDRRRGRDAPGRRRRRADLPVHPRLPRRPGAVLRDLRRRRLGPDSSSGTRSRPPPPRPCSTPAAPSPTTTPSAATTAPGTTASGPDLFAAALRAAKRRSTRPASSTPASSWGPDHSSSTHWRSAPAVEMPLNRA